MSDPGMDSVQVQRTVLCWTVGCCCMPAVSCNVGTAHVRNLVFRECERQLVSRLLPVPSFHFAHAFCRHRRSRID